MKNESLKIGCGWVLCPAAPSLTITLKHFCASTRTHTRLHRLGVRPYIRVNIGDMKVVDKVQGADGCVYLWSQVNRRRRKLKMLDTDRLLTAAGFIGRV